jgi:hypothetical protein
VHVRLQELELREVAAALAVALDLVAVLHLVQAMRGSAVPPLIITLSYHPLPDIA